MRKLKRFMCISGIILIVGIIIAITGVALGGFNELGKIDKKIPYVNLGSEEMHTENYQYKDLKAIEVDYDYCDIKVVEGDSFKVDVRYSENDPLLQVAEENGVLKITSVGEKKSFLDIDVFDDSHIDPEIVITCPARGELSNLTINTDYGDVYLLNVSASICNITTADGDIKAFFSDALEKYKINISAKDGDIEINDMDYDDAESYLSGLGTFKRGEYTYSGANAAKTLKVETDYGDVEMEFLQ